MSQSQLDEHRGYLGDARKLAAYRAALDEVVRPGDTVLDLGAGSGVLGCLACDAGARTVVAVDRGDILGLARQIALDNGYGDRITHIQALSTELVLDAPVDVVVCDQIGGLVHDAGILACFADARRRLLAPGGRFVPASFRISLVPATFDRGRETIEFWTSRPATLDTGAARPLAANTEWKFKLGADDLVALAPAEVLASFDADHDGPITGSATFAVDHPGRFDGCIGWFQAQMSPSVTLTNDPRSPDRFDRWCNYYPVEDATDVQPGDRITLRLDIRPRLGVVSWTTEVSDGDDGRPRRYRNSTFNGTFLTLSTVDGLDRSRPLARTDRVEIVQRMLDLIDGSTSQTALADALADQVGGAFASPAHVRRFVQQVAELIGP